MAAIAFEAEPEESVRGSGVRTYRALTAPSGRFRPVVTVID